jgi:general secretion pathway protein C
VKRHAPNVIVVTICAALAGRIAASWIVGSYLVGEAAPARVVGPPAPLAAPPHGKEPTAIVERNIFCSGCVPPSQAKVAAAREAEQKREPQKSELKLALLGILRSPDASLAVLRDLSTSQKDAALLAEGRPVFETGAVVASIHPRRVYLSREGQLEYLDLDEAKPAPPPPSKPAAVAPPTPQTAFAAQMDRAIACNGMSCQVERSLVDQVLQNTMLVATSARFIPILKDGKPGGFRLAAMRPGSLFERIGLKNGDTIRAINGNEMSTPDQALALYAKLRSASHLSVDIERGGAASRLDYTIR